MEKNVPKNSSYAIDRTQQMKNASENYIIMISNFFNNIFYNVSRNFEFALTKQQRELFFAVSDVIYKMKSVVEMKTTNRI